MSKFKKMDPVDKKKAETSEEFFSEGLKLDSDPQCADDYSRREVLDFLTKAGAATVFLPSALSSKSAVAAPITGDFKFCLYIHFGSQCGYSNGLIMPNDVGTYPKDVFVRGQQAQATNPILNVHLKQGPLVLNPYTLSLAGISGNISNGIVNARSAGHATAKWYQATGHGRVSSYGPSWQVGLAGALAGHNGMTAIPVVNNLGGIGHRSIGLTRTVNVDTSRSLSTFYSSNTDHSTVPRTPSGMVSRLWQFAESHYKNQLGITNKDDAVRAKLGQYIEAAVRGVAEVGPGSSIETSVTAAINADNVRSQIDTLPLGEKESREVKGLISSNLINQLQLAAALIRSRLGAGMSIGLSGDDYHRPSVSTATRTDNSGSAYSIEVGGGAETTTARRGSAAWAAIRLFWNYVQSLGMADKVIVICSHEFTRTAANKNTQKHSVFVPNGSGESEQLVDIYGKDHQPVAGYQIITGAFPGQKRFGTVADSFAAGASKDALGTIDLESPAYNSRDLVGSFLYKFAPELFPRAERDVRLYYGPDYEPIDLIINS